LAAVGLAAACGRQTHAAADLVLVHAKVWTGDRSRPAADGVAVVADRIVDVGGADQIDRWRGPDTRVVDAAGRRVVPGFNDAHVHFVDGGRQLDNVDLKDADSPEELARRIGARGNPTGVLKDAAMSYVSRVIPPLTREQRTHAVKRALEHAASIGVTSVQDMNPEYADIAVYADLANRGELTARIYAAPLETG